MGGALTGAAEPAGAPLTARQLRSAIRRVRRAQSRRGLLLIGPMLLYTLLLFGLPLMRMAWQSVASPEIRATLPDLARAISEWDGKGLPPEAVTAAMVHDLRIAARQRTVFLAATRLNYQHIGMRSLLVRSAERLARLPADPAPDAAAETLSGLDARWSDPATWALIRSAARPVTPYYLLTALDLQQSPSGAIVAVPPDQALFVDILLRTLWISAMVTLATAILGFPVAHLLANVSAQWRGWLMIPVLLPFWTSLLVRICAWIVLLQREGIVNHALLALGIVSRPLQLVFNRTGVYLVMVHVLLPFMILPLYSVMRGIPPSYMRAAASLGAAPVRAFLTAYVPQVLPGIGAGCTLVFILAIGYYVTPALVGGSQDQMISSFIAFYTNQTVNWSMASALAVILLVATSVLYAVYQRLVGSSGPRLG